MSDRNDEAATDAGEVEAEAATDAGEVEAEAAVATAETDDEAVESGAATATSGDVRARYEETEAERLLTFSREDRTAVVAQNREGYAMVTVRPVRDGDELERYYGFDMALDHAAELLGVSPRDLPVPDAAADMGM